MPMMPRHSMTLSRHQDTPLQIPATLETLGSTSAVYMLDYYLPMLNPNEGYNESDLTQQSAGPIRELMQEIRLMYLYKGSEFGHWRVTGGWDAFAFRHPSECICVIRSSARQGATTWREPQRRRTEKKLHSDTLAWAKRTCADYWIVKRTITK